MEASSNSSASPHDPDPEPGPGTTAQEQSSREQSPGGKHGESSAMKKEKGRVRFNSTAAVTGPPPTTPPKVPGPILEHSHAPIPKPRPSVLRGNSSNSVHTVADIHDLAPSSEKASSAAAAQERARQVAAKVWNDSPRPDSSHSVDSDGETAASEGELIPLRDLGYARRDISPSQHSEDQHHGLQQEAHDLVRAHTQRFGRGAQSHLSNHQPHDEERAVPTEVNDGIYGDLYSVPPPQNYRGGVLSQLLTLYKPPEPSSHNRNRDSVASFSGFTGQSTPGTGSGTATPSRKKWYNQNRSQDTLVTLVGASARLANPNTPGEEQKASGKKKHPGHKRTGSSSRLSAFLQQEEVRITVHIAETLARQEYIIRLCRALMLFGAPTHRLEEYLQMTARVLEIDGQFLYLPGCMIISFDDRSTHTTEVKIVRTAQGIDLGKLKDLHLIYKEVMHDVIGVEEGTQKLNELISSRDKFHAWFRVLIFGLTSAMAAPFSFKARLIDLPLCFFLGCLVGLLQLIIAPKSNLYNNVLEVSATVLVSFLARVFGSINGGSLFCFSALAQGGIVMLLPGYLVLCSSLELQSRAIIPGSIRIVYAIIYSLLLGFGITVGAALYGLMDDNASSATTCEDPLSSYWGFIFVPGFVMCISILYQAKWQQMPVMVLIACTGYIVNYFSSLKFSASPAISNTFGALTVGLLANLYSRLRHGVAAATLIPAIFTQVPGGLASNGGLLTGIATANMLTNSSSTTTETTNSLNTVVFGVAASMIQIAIGIAVGLFISALLVYPLGKRRSGLFSF
ncbi:pheromone-regulated membrane protein [Dactylonectria estremocensis]|uniref:Pheromone-regulated membrane protein n=1 Tax=Dactylonectria estremocensis TaxID=1079267 RepID=A0A9P9DN66_9HYPO|nr:pheromone-regulated membrane protein [Dactylonectria estremocensis]